MMNGLQRRDDFMNNMLSWFDDSFAPFTNHESGEMRTDITEDDHKKCEKDLQDMTDKYVKKIDDMCSKKEKELMEL